MPFFDNLYSNKIAWRGSFSHRLSEEKMNILNRDFPKKLF